MAMVVRQNKYDPNIGGHISTYASLATLPEVGFNHFFHGSYGDQPGDFVYFQGHASPGRLCARVSRRPAERRAPRRISGTNCASIPGCRRIRTRG